MVINFRAADYRPYVFALWFNDCVADAAVITESSFAGCHMDSGMMNQSPLSLMLYPPTMSAVNAIFSGVFVNLSDP